MMDPRTGPLRHQKETVMELGIFVMGMVEIFIVLLILLVVGAILLFAIRKK